jgi:broad specificity phosphatase PhoE
MEILLIRHAQAETAAGDKADPPLSDTGKRQAESLARAAAAWKRPAEILVSPTRRTRETAAPLAGVFGVSPEPADWLEEIRPPSEWLAMPADQLRTLLKSARARPANEWWAGMPGGEPFREFQERICTHLREALERRGARPSSPGTPVRTWDISNREAVLVLVAHAGANAVAMEYLLGIETVPWAWHRFEFVHTSVTRIKAFPLMGAHVFSLVEHSGANHLAPELRTH